MNQLQWWNDRYRRWIQINKCNNVSEYPKIINNVSAYGFQNINVQNIKATVYPHISSYRTDPVRLGNLWVPQFLPKFYFFIFWFSVFVYVNALDKILTTADLNLNSYLNKYNKYKHSTNFNTTNCKFWIFCLVHKG